MLGAWIVFLMSPLIGAACKGHVQFCTILPVGLVAAFFVALYVGGTMAVLVGVLPMFALTLLLGK